MIQAFAAHSPGGKLEPFEYDPGPLGTHEVEIEVEHCGICHSDLSMLDNKWKIAKYPLVPGHEVVGKIAKIGSEVSTLKIGDLVGLGWHSKYCMTCPTCLGGDHNLCSQAQATIIGHHGGFADRVRADEVSVFKLPNSLNPKSAGPLFCGGITVFNPLVQSNLLPTSKAAVIGIGGLGHLALQFLKAWGCEVTAFTSSEEKKHQALKFGAHHTINSKDSAAIESAAGQFDLILSTVNVKLNWKSYLSTLSPKGRLHFLGVVLNPLDIHVMQMIGSQLTVSASPVGSPAIIKKMLSFAARHNIEPMIETYPFDQVNEAIDHLKEGKAHYRIVLSRST